MASISVTSIHSLIEIELVLLFVLWISRLDGVSKAVILQLIKIGLVLLSMLPLIVVAGVPLSAPFHLLKRR